MINKIIVFSSIVITVDTIGAAGQQNDEPKESNEIAVGSHDVRNAVAAANFAPVQKILFHC